MSADTPDVPVGAPGVPAVNTAPGSVSPSVPASTGDSPAVASSFSGPKWGIFRSGAAPVVGSSVTGFEFKKEARVADHPIESGSFSTYNKVMLPFDARITITTDGTTAASRTSGLSKGAAANRAAFLAIVDEMVTSLEIVSVATPEFTYPSANCVSYQYSRRSRDGVSWIICEIALKEIRMVAPNGFSAAPAPQQPEGADPLSGGAPQTTKPTPAQTPPSPNEITAQAAASASAASVDPALKQLLGN